VKARSSGLKGTSIAICDFPCWYLGITLVTEDAQDVVATVWDSPTTTTTDDTEVDYVKCTDETLNVCHIMRFPVWCSKGISVVLSAVQGDYIVWFAK